MDGPKAPPVYRPVTGVQAKPGVPGPPAPWPPVYRPNAPVQAKPQKPAPPPVYRPGVVQAKPSAHFPPVYRPSVIQRAKEEVLDDPLTDDEEELTKPKWVHFTERPKMSTLYSFALASPTAQPVVNEGPHTIANVAHRYFFEQLVAKNSWDEVAAVFANVANVDQIKEVIESEGVEDLGRPGYYKAYSDTYDLAKDQIGKKSGTIKDAVLLIWQLENLHPFACFGWKGALRGKKVSHGSSKTKGEALMIRPTGVPSATKSLFYDKGSKFNQKERFEKWREERVHHTLGSEARAKRHLAHVAGGKEKREEALAKKREGE